MTRRRIDFDTFEILRTLCFIVGNRGGLQAAITRLKGKLTFAFIDHGDPAFKNLEHLEIAQMSVHTGGTEQLISLGFSVHTQDRGVKPPPR